MNGHYNSNPVCYIHPRWDICVIKLGYPKWSQIIVIVIIVANSMHECGENVSLQWISVFVMQLMMTPGILYVK